MRTGDWEQKHTDEEYQKLWNKHKITQGDDNFWLIFELSDIIFELEEKTLRDHAVSPDTIKAICDLTLELVRFKVKNCSHLCTENTGSKIFDRLLSIYNNHYNKDNLGGKPYKYEHKDIGWRH